MDELFDRIIDFCVAHPVLGAVGVFAALAILLLVGYARQKAVERSGNPDDADAGRPKRWEVLCLLAILAIIGSVFALLAFLAKH